MHKSGFVNIIGNPNVGKSTLMNALVGERLSIITSKAQTTRHRIMGIVSGDDFQIVYSDTPGILKPTYKMQESMMKFVTGALTDADVILYVTDTVEQSERAAGIIARINRSGIPTIVVVNKIDLSTPAALDALVGGAETVVDRPRGSHHPDFPEFVYELDYGYLKGTTSADSEGIDVWIGSDPRRQVTGALCTVDLVKHDAELKILVGCTAGDCAVIRRFYRTPLSAVRILRRKKP